MNTGYDHFVLTPNPFVHAALFDLRDVSEITGVEPTRIQMWHHRGFYEVQHRPDKRSGRGFARRYTAGDVLAIWILAYLVDKAGVDLGLAAKAAKLVGWHLVQAVESDPGWMTLDPSKETADLRSGEDTLNGVGMQTFLVLDLSLFQEPLRTVLKWVSLRVAEKQA